MMTQIKFANDEKFFRIYIRSLMYGTEQLVIETDKNMVVINNIPKEIIRNFKNGSTTLLNSK